MTRLDRRPIYRDKNASVPTEEELELSTREAVRIAVRSLKNISAAGWIGQQHRRAVGGTV